MVIGQNTDSIDYDDVVTLVETILHQEYDNGIVARQFSREQVIQMVLAAELELALQEDDYDDGQPSWEQEWEDFGEVYSDEY